jgi:hypothetical protein
MLLGLAVLLAAAAALHWRVRGFVRPARPVDRAETWAVFLLQLALGAGVPLYLASRPVVYHEAELWGAALSVAALVAILDVVRAPTGRSLVWAGLATALALNTRFSVGMGPVLALALLTVAFAARLWAAHRPGRAAELVASFGPPAVGRAERRTLALLLATWVVPLALHAAVNIAKFDRPFGIPIDKQVASRVEPDRRAALDANGGTIFGLKFAPTALVQAARPDAVGGLRAFPFVSLPAEPAKVIGDVRFDTVQPSLSATTSMPALVVLTLFGIVVAIRRRRLWPLLSVLTGAAGGFAVTVTIAFVTTRYLADLVPFVLLGGLIGAQALLAASRHRGWLLGAVGLLAAVGFVVNASAGLASQRLFYPETTESERSAFVATQQDVDDALGRSPSGVFRGDELPVDAPGRPGDLFVLDRCAGLYVRGQRGEWLPVERNERSGLHRLEVRMGAGGTSTLLTLGSGGRRVSVTGRRRGDAATFAVRVGNRTVATGRPVPVPAGRPARVLVSIDPLYGSLEFGRFYTTVSVDGRRGVTARTPYDRRSAVTLGRGVERVAAPAPACRALARAAHLVSGSRAGG